MKIPVFVPGDCVGLVEESRLIFICGNKLLSGLAGNISSCPKIIEIFWVLKLPFLDFFILKRSQGRPCTVKVFSLKMVSER